MFGHTFYYGLTRKYVSYFGTIFNDIYILRTPRGSTDPSDRIKVPLVYASKDKMIQRVTSDPDIDRPAAIVLPRMSFEIDGRFDFDSERNFSTLQEFVVENLDDPNRMKSIYVGYPVDIPFNLYVYVKNTEDGLQIIEQIKPFFKPEWTSTLQLIPEMNISMDIPIEHVSTTFEDRYDGSFRDRQVQTYTLQFNMRAWFFGPVYNKPIIKFAFTNYRLGEQSEANEPVGTVEVRPGLTADGEPTSNASLSIDAGEITVSDDFGFIVNVSGPVLSNTA